MSNQLEAPFTPDERVEVLKNQGALGYIMGCHSLVTAGEIRANIRLHHLKKDVIKRLAEMALGFEPNSEFRLTITAAVAEIAALRARLGKVSHDDGA